MSIHFSKPVSRLFAITIVLSIAGCASGPKLRSDYDSSADFGAYRTYNFIERTNDDNYQSLFSKYMVEAITVEMEKRGYVRSDDPDLLVNFNGRLQEKTNVRTTTAPPPMMAGGYYGYRGGYYGAWGSYGYGTETHVSQYTEGTFNIDLVDARRKQLVWEAVGIARVTDETFEQLEERVKAGVPQFFALYPFVAGDPNPQSR
jgi:hypothetical protein